MKNVLTLAVIGLALVGFTNCSRQRTNQGGSSTVANVEPPADILTIGGLEVVDGTNYRFTRVGEALRRQTLSSDSYGNSRTRNVVFLDCDSLQSHRLFETNRNVVLDVVPLGRGATGLKDAPTPPATSVRWLMYRVVATDTDGDGDLDASDSFGIGFTDASGHGFAELVPNVQRLLGTAMIGDDAVTVAYVRDDRVEACRIDLVGKRVVATQPMVGIEGIAEAQAQ
jgi:hypothetical protein